MSTSMLIRIKDHLKSVASETIVTMADDLGGPDTSSLDDLQALYRNHFERLADFVFLMDVKCHSMEQLIDLAKDEELLLAGIPDVESLLDRYFKFNEDEDSEEY